MTTPGSPSPQTDSGAPFRPLQVIVGLGGIQVLTMLAGLGRTKILAVLLGPDGVGIVSVVDQVLALITHVGTLSLPMVALKYLSRARADGWYAFGRLYRALLWILGVMVIVGTAGGVAVAVWRPQVVAADLVAYRAVLVAALLAAPPLAAAAFLRSVLASIDRNRAAALFALAAGLALVGSAYVGVRSGGLLGLYVANFGVHVATVTAMIAFVGRAAGRATPVGIREVGPILRAQEGLPWFVTGFHLLSVASPFAYLVARAQILDRHGAAAAGLFAAAYGLAVAVRVVLNQANGLYLMPLVNRPLPKVERARLSGEYLRVLTVLLGLSALVVVLFARVWIRLLFSGAFLHAATMLGPFVVGEAVLLLAGVYQALLIGFDDLRAYLAITLTANLVVAAGALAMVGPLGPVGAAYAFIAGHGVILTGCATRLAVRHRAAAALGPLGQVIGTLAVIWLASVWVVRWAPGIGWRLIACAVCTGVALAALSGEERRWLLRPWRGTPG